MNVPQTKLPSAFLVIFSTAREKAPDMKPYLSLISFLILSNLSWGQEAKPEYYIHSIYFGGGSYFIDLDQINELNIWLDGIPELETHEISIHSHTDNIGSKAYNQWLSQMRSEAAFQKLLDYGLPEHVITITDFGEVSPVFDNDTWEGKLKNRRVDIIIKPISM